MSIFRSHDGTESHVYRRGEDHRLTIDLLVGHDALHGLSVETATALQQALKRALEYAGRLARQECAHKKVRQVAPAVHPIPPIDQWLLRCDDCGMFMIHELEGGR